MLKELYEKIDKNLSIEHQAIELKNLLLKLETSHRYQGVPISWLEHKILTGEVKSL